MHQKLINWVVAARRKYPNRCILATTIDYKSAYRRRHLNAKTAIQICTQLPTEGVAIIALRLTFGVDPGPYEWGVVSESIFDLAMKILRDDDWDPVILHAPNPELVSTVKFLDNSIPFGEGKQLIVDVSVNSRGVIDVFIDDSLGLTIDMEDSNNMRLECAPLLAIYTCAYPKHISEPIPRDEMTALSNVLAEARLEAIKTILGWSFDFRRIFVALTENKFKAWSEAIRDILENGSMNAKELEENIGRLLVHLSLVLLFAHHFLSRLRELHRRAINRRQIRVTEMCTEDLKLMLYFLEKTKNGCVHEHDCLLQAKPRLHVRFMPTGPWWI